MPLINTSVPNLIQGVSQQPSATRFDGQCEEQENALSSVAEGLKKRPNTRHVARLLEEAISADSFVHFINRDDNEKYVLIHDGAKLRVYNTLTGAEGTINGSVGGFPCSGNYLESSNPLSEIKSLTVADNTFLLNTTTQVQKDTTNLSEPLSDYAVATVTQGSNGKRYKIIAERRLPAAVVSVDITPSGTQFLHTFTIEDGGLGYGLVPDGLPNIIEGSTSVAVFPKGYTASHPAAVTGSIDTDEENKQTTYTTMVSMTSSILLDEEYPEWEAEPPIYVENLGKLGTSSGTASAASSSDTSVIAKRIAARGNDHLDADITDLESASFMRNFSWKVYGNSIVINVNTTDDLGAPTDTFRVNTTDNLYYDSLPHPNAEVTFRTEDGLAGEGIKAAYKNTDAITNLPFENQHGFKIKITGDADLEQDDYFVRFETEGGYGFGAGSYVETVGGEIETDIDHDTFPLRLVSTASDTFTLNTIATASRDAGDDDTNPFSSFVGKTISNLFFYKNRLGLLSDDNVIFSEAGEFFNFFRISVRSLLDSDPIDVAVSSSNVNTLSSAVGFQENLVIFSTNGQFVLKGGDLLTAKTVSIAPITNFDTASRVEPLPLGSYIYFPFNRGSFSGIREFTVNANTDNYDASEVTEHVPSYVPKNIIDIAGTTSEDIIALLSGDDKGSLYIYNYFWDNNKKVLSAWSRFSFVGEIRGIEFIDSTLYAVITNNGETNLVEMPLESGLTDAAGYVTHLDMRVANTVLSGASVINLPYTPEDDSIEVYTTDGLALSCSNVGSVVTLSSSVAADTDVWVGIPYTMKYTFSEQLFKAQAGNGKSPSNAAKLMIRNGSVYYNKSASFKVKVTPKFRDTYENVFTPDVVGSTTLGSLNLDSGFYRFPVFTKPEDTTITIENDSALPSTFQSAEFESFVHSRSNRYG